MNPDLNELLSRLNPTELTRLPREDRERLLAALQEDERRRLRAPLATVRPHEKQQEFIASRRRIRIFLGGNRSGKTWVGIMEALAHALGYRPWQVPDFRLTDTDPPDFPPRTSVPEATWVRTARGDPVAVPNVGIVVSGQGLSRGLGPTIWPRIRELWPREVPLRSWHGPLGTPVKFELPNGSTVFLASAIQDRMTFEGARYDWAYLDEPVPAYVFNGLWRGLTDTYGNIWLTQTPLGADSRWLYTGLIAQPRDDVEVITVGIHDNPFLDRASVEEFERTTTWTDQERAARLHGRFEFLSDTVWPAFTASHHVVAPFEIPPDWLRGCTVDPHLRRPWAIIWWACDPMGRLVIYREWPRTDFRLARATYESPAEYVNLIRSEEGKERITWRFLDPNFGRHPGVVLHGGKKMGTIQQELAAYGLDFSCRINDDLAFGIAAVADALRCDPNLPPEDDNTPRLRVFSTCRNTIAAFENFSFLPEKDPDRPNQLVHPGFKDFADLIRYTVVAPRARVEGGWSYLDDDELRRWINED